LIELGAYSVWRDTPDTYGHLSIFLHWLIAGVATGLFALGLWMVGLDYYDAWYHRAPELHKGTGVLLLGVMLLRLAWRCGNSKPRLSGTPLQRRLARAVHRALYGLLFAVIISGYLVSTADGRAIDVFGFMQLPATLSDIDRQEDIAGMFHKALAMVMMALAALHALAALKHHLVDHDRTLLRMLPGKKNWEIHRKT
jgi:cytochrome b561